MAAHERKYSRYIYESTYGLVRVHATLCREDPTPLGEMYFDRSSTGASFLSEIHFHPTIEGELRTRQSSRLDWNRSIAMPISVFDLLVSLLSCPTFTLLPELHRAH